jgi:predicted nuclease of predicted toxin-antitoxin system
MLPGARKSRRFRLPDVKMVIDMNLPPRWIDFFSEHGLTSRHWSDIVKANAIDSDILVWGKDNQYIIFTHDLDFGTILAVTQANAPSVVQVRTQNIVPEVIGDIAAMTNSAS